MQKDSRQPPQSVELFEPPPASSIRSFKGSTLPLSGPSWYTSVHSWGFELCALQNLRVVWPPSKKWMQRLRITRKHYPTRMELAEQEPRLRAVESMAQRMCLAQLWWKLPFPQTQLSNWVSTWIPNEHNVTVAAPTLSAVECQPWRGGSDCLGTLVLFAFA